MRPIRPVAINPTPSIVVLMLGGLTGALLMLSLVYAAPLAGWPALDLLRGIGGIFTADPSAALAVGTMLFLLGAVPLLPMVALLTWSVMPGPVDTLRGSLLNGAVIGVAAWITLGIVLGVAAAIGRLPGEMPGWFGLGVGLQGAVLFAAGAFLYGVAVALVGFLEQGISPMDAVGWSGFTYAATGPMELNAHRSNEPPPPPPGERPWRPRG